MCFPRGSSKAQFAPEVNNSGAAAIPSSSIDSGRVCKIAIAREEFSKLSEHAIKLASGQSGYYVVNCPMVHKDWVQPAGQLSNPYAGQSMPTCGMIKKAAK